MKTTIDYGSDYGTDSSDYQTTMRDAIDYQGEQRL